MPILWLSLGWVVGIVAGAFLLVQSLIVLFVGLPLAISGVREGLLKSKAPIFQYAASLVLLPLIFAALTYFLVVKAPAALTVGYFIGLLISLVQGLPKCGRNPTNIAEFMQTNAVHLDKAKVAELMGEQPLRRQHFAAGHRPIRIGSGGFNHGLISISTRSGVGEYGVSTFCVHAPVGVSVARITTVLISLPLSSQASTGTIMGATPIYSLSRST